jgi:hypothetical protein
MNRIFFKSKISKQDIMKLLMSIPVDYKLLEIITRYKCPYDKKYIFNCRVVRQNYYTHSTHYVTL